MIFLRDNIVRACTAMRIRAFADTTHIAYTECDATYAEVRTMLGRFVAVLLLVIPGIAATYGFILIKQAVLLGLGPAPFPWGNIALGAVLFFLGTAFIGGWIFYRDRKRNYVAPRFRKKRPRRDATPRRP
jgi:hypothetical protein